MVVLIFEMLTRNRDYLRTVYGFILQVEIRGGPDIFIHDGSPALLECVVTDFILPPQTVAWRHNSDSSQPGHS